MDPKQEQEQRDQERLARAFKAFQDASRNKSTDPETFKAARTRYFFLKNGPTWLEQEKARISSEQIDPVLSTYRDTYISLESEEKVQSAYTDSIAAIRETQSIQKEDATRKKSFLQNLLDDQTQKKSAFDRYVELTSPSNLAVSIPQGEVSPFVRYFSGFPSSFTLILDILIALLVISVLVTGFYKSRIGFQMLLNRTAFPGLPGSAPGTPGTPGSTYIINSPAMRPFR
jgi:hypothetical protein